MTSHFHHPVAIQTFPVNIPSRERLTCLQLEDAQGNTLLIYLDYSEVNDLRDVLACVAAPIGIAA